MNYLRELNLFHQRVDTVDIPANAILLWYTLMSIANSLHWREEFNITISTLESKTKLSKSSICRMRDVLIERGLIEYRPQSGRLSGFYKVVSQIACHTDTQGGTQSDFACQSETLSGNIHRDKNNNKTKNIEMEVGAEAPPMVLNSTPERKEKNCGKKEKKSPPPLFDHNKWVAELGEAWGEVMRVWLEYKESRKERYKSEMSVKLCLKKLEKLAGGNEKTALEIVEQSIANNWAGLFELKERASYGRGGANLGRGQPATGQHIGQIKQPKSEEHKQRLLDKLKPKH